MMNPRLDGFANMASNISFPGISSEAELKSLQQQKGANGQFKGIALAGKPIKMADNRLRLQHPVSAGLNKPAQSGNQPNFQGNSVLGGNVLQKNQTDAGTMSALAI